MLEPGWAQLPHDTGEFDPGCDLSVARFDEQSSCAKQFCFRPEVLCLRSGTGIQ